MRKALLYSFFALVTVSLIIRCGEDDPKKGAVPKLTTTTISEITQIAAQSGGTITSDGGDKITARGVCWATSPDPTVEDDKTFNGKETGGFVSNLTALTGGTTYYVRAYASNKNGTGYGNAISFTTDDVTLATLTTAPITSVGRISAISGGQIISPGGGLITARGVCWSKAPDPTIINNKTANGTGEGVFLSDMLSLDPSTKYYVRAYATNAAGTAYGESVTFKTINEYSGVYEITAGSVFREIVPGIPDPTNSGNYPAGTQMELTVVSSVSVDSVEIFPLFASGSGIGQIERTIMIIDKTITSTDGSHPVKIISTSNATLKNIAGSENKFFPGTPGTFGKTTAQEFLLNFEWQTGIGPFNHRNITNLRIKFVL